MTSITRRDWARIASGLALGTYAGRPTPSPAPGPAPWHDSSIFLDGTSGPVRIRFFPRARADALNREKDGPGEFTLIRVAPEKIPEPPTPGNEHPRPIESELIRCTDSEAVFLVRTWRTEDIAACRLCTLGCNGSPAPGLGPGLATCTVQLPDRTHGEAEEFTLVTRRYPLEA